MIIDLTKLQADQLDFINFLEDRPEMINQKNKLGLTTGQVLATISELFEVGNEAKQIYKWWDKSEINKEKLLEELSDVLSHLLNMANVLDVKLIIDVERVQEIRNLDSQLASLTYTLLRFTASTNKIFSIRRLKEIAIPDFLNFAYSLGFTFEELEEAYYKKLDSNYTRFE
ncbi:MAG: dUTP diphosphatase [Paraclostridium sp.]